MIMRRAWLRIFTLLLITVTASLHLIAQTPVSYERLRSAAKEPQNWLTYGGDYFSARYSALTQITPANVKNLNLAWVYQAPVAGSWQPTPIVAEGIMYLTQRPNDVIALDAATGRVFWVYRHTNEDVLACCGSNNRGVAILGETLFMGTLDGHLVAIDAKSGRQVWKTRVADSKQGYSVTVAPLAIKDRVVIGVGGGDTGFAASSPPTTHRPARNCGVSTPFRVRENPDTKRGKHARPIRRRIAIPKRGNTAAPPCG